MQVPLEEWNNVRWIHGAQQLVRILGILMYDLLLVPSDQCVRQHNLTRRFHLCFGLFTTISTAASFSVLRFEWRDKVKDLADLVLVLDCVKRGGIGRGVADERMDSERTAF